MKRNYYLTAVLLIAVVLVISIVFYPRLPQKIPTHWNIHGQVDGYGEKTYTAFLGPMIMTGLVVLFLFLPALSPRRFEVDATARPIYLYIMLLIVGLMGYFHLLSLLAALKQGFDAGRAMIGGLFLVMALLGNVLGKVPRNFYIGVRTPWTIADERVWFATHRLAAKCMVAGSLLGFLAVVVEGWVAPGFVIYLVALFVPVVYSFICYRRLQRRGEV